MILLLLLLLLRLLLSLLLLLLLPAAISDRPTAISDRLHFLLCHLLLRLLVTSFISVVESLNIEISEHQVLVVHPNAEIS